MKVSIATLHGANNVGAFLQAFALQTVIEEIIGQGNCSFISIDSHRAEQTNKLKKVIKYLKHNSVAFLLYKYRTAKQYANVKHVLHIDPNKFSEDREYDTVVVGSDEVWNLNSPSFLHHEQYFARNIQARNLVAYAPCAGNMTADMFVEKEVNFKAFHHLSVRDKNTFDVVRTLDARVPTIVCDPTVLIKSFDPYIKNSVNESNFILVYSYGLKPENIVEIKKYARIHHKKLISVGTYNKWCDKNIVADPFTFLSWLRAADMVVTSTFHGTVLSVRFHKQVAVFAGGNRKVEDFLTQTELQERNVSKAGALSGVFAKEIDYCAVEQKLGLLRLDSMRYLMGALNGNGD